jgi:hypothetical protein
MIVEPRSQIPHPPIALIFPIQFIQFGSNEIGTRRLHILDGGLRGKDRIVLYLIKQTRHLLFLPLVQTSHRKSKKTSITPASLRMHITSHPIPDTHCGS